MKTIEPFAASPNDFVAIHKVCFDFIMPIVSDSAWKVLCFIIRKTRGFQKVADDIAYAQIAGGTGISSPNAIRLALMELQGYVPIREKRSIKGWRRDEERPILILAFKNKNADKTNAATTYRLNQGFQITFENKPIMLSIESSEPIMLSIETIDKAINKESISINTLNVSKSISFSSIVSDVESFDEPDEETINWLRQQS
jgi:hypothetical protein